MAKALGTTPEEEHKTGLYKVSAVRPICQLRSLPSFNLRWVSLTYESCLGSVWFGWVGVGMHE
jgi:hypothetical protein